MCLRNRRVLKELENWKLHILDYAYHKQNIINVPSDSHTHQGRYFLFNLKIFTMRDYKQSCGVFWYISASFEVPVGHDVRVGNGYYNKIRYFIIYLVKELNWLDFENGIPYLNC